MGIGRIVLLLVSVVLVWAALGEADPRAVLVKPLEQGPPGRVELRVDRGCGALYKYGEYVNVKIWSEKPGYLTLFDFWPDGTAHILFPNQYCQDNFIEGNRWYTIPGDLYPFRFEIAPPGGEEVLFAVVTESPRKLLPEQYYDFSKVFPELPGGDKGAELVVGGVQVIPEGEWWGAAMCFFYAGEIPSTGGQGWALFVGINRYEYSPLSWVKIDDKNYALPDLVYCVADAQAMAAALKERFAHQRVLADGQATLQALREAFSDWLTKAGEDDTVLIYFSGHGARLRDKSGDEADGWDEAFVTYDRQLLVDDELAEWISQLRAENVVLIADTCYSGTIHRGIRTFHIRQESRPLFPPLKDDIAQDFTPGARATLIVPTRTRNVVVLTACKPEETAQEEKTLGHGAFTYYLLEAFKGPGDTDRDGWVTAQEAYRYASSAILQHFNQHPQLYDPSGVPVKLVRIM